MSENKLSGNSPLILDVRSEGEYAGGCFPGAINIPVDVIESKASELGLKDREITLYCASGARSGFAVQVLSSLGFTNLKNGGGIMSMMSSSR